MKPYVDPELRPALERLTSHDFSNIEAARRRALAARDLTNAGISLFGNVAIRFWEADRLGDTAVRQYTNRDCPAPRPALIWAHGGGHVLGHIDQDDAMLQALCAQVGCDVFAVALRRAPEHPFPAPVEDVYSTLTRIAHEANSLGVDARQLAIGGVSAGAGTAAGVALLARDRSEVQLRYQLLVSPMLDDQNVPPRSPEVVPGAWSGESNAYGWSAYLGAAFGTDDVSPYAAPARATDLSRLPSTFIAVGDLDLFLNEDLHYAANLGRAGVPVEAHVYPGAYHGFTNLVPDAAISRRFFHDRDLALSRALASASPSTWSH
jgi:acetyl esterase/lipase